MSEVWGDLQRASGATERLVELIQAKPAIALDHHGIDDSAKRLKEQMETIAYLIDKALMNHENESVLNEVKSEVHTLMSRFPLY